jgi:hypothetical protein
MLTADKTEATAVACAHLAHGVHPVGELHEDVGLLGVEERLVEVAGGRWVGGGGGWGVMRGWVIAASMPGAPAAPHVDCSIHQLLHCCVPTFFFPTSSHAIVTEKCYKPTHENLKYSRHVLKTGFWQNAVHSTGLGGSSSVDMIRR